MRKFSVKQLLIVSIVFFFASILIFAMLYIAINNKQDLNTIDQEQWKIEASRRDNAKSVTSFLESVSEDKKTIEKHFVSRSNVVPFLDKLETLARDSGNKPEIRSVEISNDGSSLLVDMKAYGSFESLYKYITLLENAPYGLEFLSSNIKNESPEAGLDKSREWSLSLSIKLISFINDKQ